MKQIADYSIVDHGVEHAQYFQGEGIAHSYFDGIATGAGENAKEAYEDAVEQLAIDDWNVDQLPKRPPGIRADNKVLRSRLGEEWSAEDSELHYYVSVKVREKLTSKAQRRREAGDRSVAAVRNRESHEQRRRRPGKPPRLQDVTVGVWEERDRLHIYVTDTRNDRTVAEWLDDDARQMFDDGFFQRGGRLRASVLDYCVQMGLLRE